MVPINNSDTAWLILTDYNQDNDLPHEELREDIISPDVNSWYLEHVDIQVGGGIISIDVEINVYIYSTNSVGDGFLTGTGNTIGVFGERVGGNLWCGSLVGGYYDTYQ
jgi:hypothetical protein